MTRGQDSPSNSDDGPILSPDELDISDDEHVTEIDEGRYVVSPNDPIDDVPGHSTAMSRDASSPAEETVPERELESGSGQERPSRADSQPPREAVEVTEVDVRNWLTERFEETNSRYGFDVTATFDGSITQRQMVSNDVVTIFESLILWYAQQIDSTTPVEEVLGILLMEANVPIRYPSSSLQNILESTDLSPDDSIADLVEAVGEDGICF